MNLYLKLATLRCDLQASGMKKSGHNKHANYDYFELSDMLPEINRLEQALGLCSIISFGIETATLSIVNIEKPEEQCVITTPMSTAKLPACHEVQNLGAVQTYLRRYLYTTAYGIVECDALDMTAGKGKEEMEKPAAQKPAQAPKAEPKPQNNANGQSQAKIITLFKNAEIVGKSVADIEEYVLKAYKCKPSEMTDAQYDRVMTRISEKASA
jgi:ERF superfamily.